MPDLSILSWNVAALRALVKDKKEAGQAWLRAKLSEIGDPTIVCLQETKIGRDMLTEDVAILKGYNAFFAHAHRGVAAGGAYSGVATFASKEIEVTAAVAGLVCCAYISRKGVNDLPSTAEGRACPFECQTFRTAWERVVGELDDHEQRKVEEMAAAGRAVADGKRGDGADTGASEGMMGKLGGGDDDDDEEEEGEANITYEELALGTNPENLLRKLDLEGRVVMTDHGAFVLLNVYAPFNGKPGRARFKKAFNAALSARVQALREAGRQVVLCGDLNAILHALDSVEPPTEEELVASPWVRWMRSLLTPPRAQALEQGREGTGAGTATDDDPPLLVDTFRQLHPNQPNAFTCWCNQTGARQTNYGRRIDFVLASPGLCSCLTEAAVRQEVLGSDHCPVTARFSFPAAPAAGSGAAAPVSIPSPFLAPGEEQRVLPPLCTATFPEFQAKQTSMHAFLGTGAAQHACTGINTSASHVHNQAKAAAPHPFSAAAASSSSSTSSSSSAVSSGHPIGPGQAGTRDGRGKAESKKRAASVPTAARPAPKLQLTLAHYGINAKAKASQGPGTFKAAAATAAAAAAVSVEVVDLVASASGLGVKNDEMGTASSMVSFSSSSSSSVAVSGGMPAALSNAVEEANKRAIFLNAFKSRKEEVPRCRGHGEPMVRRHVKKTDSEHCGRYFFCCARPEGAEGDKEARCKGLIWEDTQAVGAGGKRVRGLLKKG